MFFFCFFWSKTLKNRTVNTNLDQDPGLGPTRIVNKNVEDRATMF